MFAVYVMLQDILRNRCMFLVWLGRMGFQMFLGSTARCHHPSYI